MNSLINNKPRELEPSAEISPAVERELQRDMLRSPSEQEAHHAFCLREALSAKTPDNEFHIAAARCLAFLFRQVEPLVPGRIGRTNAKAQLLVQFLGLEWLPARSREIAELFRGYIATGMVDINARVDGIASNGVQVQAWTPLEYTVTAGLTRAMVVLLESGADESLVPVMPLLSKPSARMVADSGDFFGFVKHQTHPGALAMLAAARQAVMNRHVTSVNELHPYQVANAANGAYLPTRRQRL